MSKIISKHRIMELVAFLVLAAATGISIVLPYDGKTLIPFPETVIPAMNGVCALLCIPLLINPEFSALEIAILFVQSIMTVLSGYEILGIFLYSALAVLLLLAGFFRRNAGLKVLSMIVLWVCTLACLYPYGIPRMVLAYTVSLFMLSFYAYIYERLKKVLVTLVPPQDMNANLPAHGSVIHLSDFGLTDRQIMLATEYMNTEMTYRQLAEKHNVSCSTEKHDMAEIFKIFNVTNKEDFRILMLQYIVKI